MLALFGCPFQASPHERERPAVLALERHERLVACAALKVVVVHRHDLQQLPAPVERGRERLGEARRVESRALQDGGEGAVPQSVLALEQGALSGKYSCENPLPEDSQRGRTYNPLMPAIDELVAAMRPVAGAHGVSVAQVPLAWAIAKGATPIIGVTSPAQVADAAAAASCELTADEMSALEAAAAATGVDTRGGWERPMV